MADQFPNERDCRCELLRSGSLSAAGVSIILRTRACFSKFIPASVKMQQSLSPPLGKLFEIMSTTLLYQAFGIRGFEYRRTDFFAGHVCFNLEQGREKLRCPCGRGIS
jgi:hypothetical protein